MSESKPSPPNSIPSRVTSTKRPPEIEVLEVRPSKSRTEQGVIKVKTTTLNQNDEPVQVSVGNLIVRRRSASTG